MNEQTVFAPMGLVASTLGFFDPIALQQESISADEDSGSIEQLAEHCTEVKVGDRYYWMMEPDRRSVALAQLHASPERDAILAKASRSLHDGDRLGAYLVRAMHNKSFRTIFRESKHDAELVKAVRLLQQAGLDTVGEDDAVYALEDLERDVRREINKRDVKDVVEGGKPDAFIGREDAYEELKAFLSADTQPGPLALFVLTGVDGVGKSALVSEFVSKQRARPAWPPVVYFDFDRAALADANPVVLTLEFSRQLGLFAPEITAEMEAFQSRNRRGSDRTFEARATRSYAGLSDLADSLHDWKHRDGKVTIVLDTFEEVSRRGDPASRQVFSWLNHLRDVVGLGNIRVVLSGQDVSLDAMGIDGIEIDQWAHHQLRDLKPADAQELLESLGVPRQTAGRVPPAFGGNPLLLGIFHRYHKQSPEEVDALLADAEALQSERGDGYVSRPDDEVAVEHLHQRILGRISDPRVEALASPALLMRRITARVIADVLAEPCRLQLGGADEAREILDELADYVWLVRGDGDELTWHTNVRRLLLPGVRQEDEALAAAVHRAAVAYYLGPDTDLPPDKADYEARYHQAFVGELPSSLGPDYAAHLIAALGDDIEDWPLRSRADLLAAGKAYGRLSPDERAALSGPTLQFARHHAVRQQLQYGAIDEARDAMEEVSLDTDEFDEAAVVVDYAECDFPGVADRSESALEWYFGPESPHGIERSWDDHTMFEHVPWMVAVSHLADGTRSYMPAFSPRVVDRLRAGDGHSHSQPYALLFGLACAKILGEDTAADELVGLFTERGGIPPSTISRPSQLHIVQAGLQSEGALDHVNGVLIDGVERLDLFRLTAVPKLLEMLPDHAEASPLALDAARRPKLRELNAILRALRRLGLKLDSVEQLAGLESALPQVHRPVRSALKATEADSLQAALGQLSEKNMTWPDEFTPAALERRGGRGFDDTTLAAIIGTADVLGLLPDLLAEVEGRVGRPESIRQLLVAVTALQAKLLG